MLQKTLRDGHFKALQGKLELLERLCRALQKERNDLNNRLSLLQEQEDKETPGAADTPAAPQQELSVEEQQQQQGVEAGGEAGGVAEENPTQSDRQETESVHQAPRPPEGDSSTSATDNTTTAETTTASQPEETPTAPQDWAAYAVFVGVCV